MSSLTFLRTFPWRWTLFHSAIGLALFAMALLAGMWGYERFEGMSHRDAFLNAAMLLGGMGPVETNLSPRGKIFAGLYALYSGLVVIAVTGLLLAPVVHHLMHFARWEDKS
jgi:hypothetical protein